jgi:hypothetical protein
VHEGLGACVSRTGSFRNISRQERKGRKEKKWIPNLARLAREISDSADGHWAGTIAAGKEAPAEYPSKS